MNFSKILLTFLFLLFVFIISFHFNKQSKLENMMTENTEAIRDIESGSVLDINVVKGQEIYVPAYSSIKSPVRKNDILLSINLSIRNTDPLNSIYLSYVDFYNTSGKITKRFLKNPIKIDPMATESFHISQSDTIGGHGANFYLEWVADTTVNEPIVEAIMIGSYESHQGYSWTCPGRVVKQTDIKN